MKIAIIGAGAIGGLVGGYLRLKGEDVYLVGHADSAQIIRKQGLLISGVRGELKVPIEIYEKIISRPDLVILATKTQDIEGVLRDNMRLLEGSVILTVQNGIQAEAIVCRYAHKDQIISSVVMFGSTYLEPGKIIHNFEGKWILGGYCGENGKQIADITLVLDKVFSTVITDNIAGMKYLKIFVNANNCIPVLLGISMQEAFRDEEISRISIAIWKEGIKVVTRAGINLVSLPGFPLERLTTLTRMSLSEAAKVFSGIMTKLSKEPVYGSILQSIKRGRDTEIDYINGEITSLAKNNNMRALLNEKLVDMVHEVERTKKFYSREELLRATEGYLNKDE